MPNFASFQSDPDNLRTLINAQDSTGTTQPVQSDSTGNLTTIVLDGTVSSLGTISSIGTISEIVNVGTVTSILGATITAGTLTAVGTVSNIVDVGTVTSILGATITAGNLTSVGTVSNMGTLTAISQKNFLEPQSVSDIVTADAFTSLTNVTTANLGTTSFFVYNFGPGGSVDARVEISADGTNYFVDTQDTNIAVGSVDVIVPSRFLKYTRLSYRSTTTGTPSTITVIADAQGT